MLDTIPRQSITLQGQTINYLDVGSGQKTLLFVHGMGASIKGWAKNVEPLSKAHRCIALDLPNHGDSTLGDFKSDIPSFLELLTEFITALELDTFMMVGHSMGGMLSVLYAQAHPDQVEHLILLAPAGFEKFTDQELGLVKQVFTPEFIQSYPLEKITTNFHLNFYQFPADAQFLIEDRETLISEPKRYALYAQSSSIMAISIISTALPEMITDFKTDCTIIYGKEDKLIPHHLVHPDMALRHVTDSATATLGGELMVLPDCGHYVMWEQAELVNEAILEVIDKVV